MIKKSTLKVGIDTGLSLSGLERVESGAISAVNSASVVVIGVGGAKIITSGGGETSSGTGNKVNNIADWMGKDTKVITNKAGDKIFLSSDGSRRILFDINRPSPHISPHSHVEILRKGK